MVKYMVWSSADPNLSWDDWWICLTCVLTQHRFLCAQKPAQANYQFHLELHTPETTSKKHNFYLLYKKLSAINVSFISKKFHCIPNIHIVRWKNTLFIYNGKYDLICKKYLNKKKRPLSIYIVFVYLISLNDEQCCIPIHHTRGWPDFTNIINAYSIWRHQMETFSDLLALCAGNSPHKRPVTWCFDVFYYQLSKQWGRRWFETPSR